MLNRTCIILFLFLFMAVFTSCKKKQESPPLSLQLIASYPVSIPECSGLSWYKNDQLLTVSDSLSHVYVISLTGQVIDTMAFDGGNLEGVTYHPKTQHIFVVEEKKKEVVELGSTGAELHRFKINVQNQLAKHGPEGIGIDTVANHLFVINEKFPGRMYTYSTMGALIDSTELTFAKDYSSIYFDAVANSIWILSDESQTVTRCSLSAIPQQTWQTGIEKGEGLVVDAGNRRMYIITDNQSRLYIFGY